MKRKMYGYSDITNAGNKVSTSFQGFFTNSLPTFEKRLDRYFLENFEAIIDEWALLTEDDLLELERRLDKAIDSLRKLEKSRSEIEDDLMEIQSLISELETEHGN